MSDAATAFDEVQEAVSAPTVEGLQSIESLVNRAIDLTKQISDVEEYTKKLRAELHDITSTRLVDAMSAAGTTEFKTKDVKVKIKDFVSGSLPKDPDARYAALKWIESVGAQDIIKNHLEADFGKSQDNLVAQVEALLDNLGIEYLRQRDVHPSTLKSFANERMANGEEIPLERLGLFAGRAAEIKPIKK